MVAILINGKAIARQINNETLVRVEVLKKQGLVIRLAVVLVGDDAASHLYVRNKKKAALAVGIDFILRKLTFDVSQEIIIETIKNLQDKENVTGLIVQLPLPDPLYTPKVLNAIDPCVDVDCLTDVNLGKLVMKTNIIAPPTPSAVFAILNNLDFSLPGKKVIIIGVGALVGKPLAIMMMNARATVTTCNTATPDLPAICKAADIIVTGVGKKHILTGDMVKKGAIVIDTGVSFESGKMYGDVDIDSVSSVAAFVTPTPGGVGPITVAALLRNTVICAENS